MTRKRHITRIALAAILACLMLAACAYMLRGLLTPNKPDYVVLFDPRNPDASRHDEHYARWMAAYERVPLARIPWQRTTASLTETSLPSASLPWVRDIASQHLTTVSLAAIPTIRRRPDPTRPDPADVPLAVPAWSRSSARPDPASVAAAELPRIKPRRIVRNPDPVHLALAKLPQLAPRRNPAKPDPAALPPAAIPWARDAAKPQPAEISPAHVPSALTASTVQQRH